MVTLQGVTTTDVNVDINWMVNGSAFTGDPGRVTITEENLLGNVVRGRVAIQSLQQSDSGRYTCQVVVTPGEGDVPTVMASNNLDMTVISESFLVLHSPLYHTSPPLLSLPPPHIHVVPTVEVTTNPPSLRILDHQDYDNFSITCTASASAQNTLLDLEEVGWERRAGDSGSFLPVPTSSYTTTNINSVYMSVLRGSETDTSATIYFRCTATISGVEGSSSTSVTVSGKKHSL